MSNALGFPVSGAQVTLKNGDVEYYGTADEQGNYSVNVIKYDYTYELIATAAMYTPATESVSFANGNVSKDVVMALAEGNYIVCGNLTLNGQPAENEEVVLLNQEAEIEKVSTNAEGFYAFAPHAMSAQQWQVRFSYGAESIDLESAESGIIVIDRELGEHTGVASVGAAKGIDAYGIAGAIVVKASDATTVNVYNAAGALVRSVAVESGTTRLEHFSPGIYIVNKAKVVVR